jgi:hypothetical protein
MLLVSDATKSTMWNYWGANYRLRHYHSSMIPELCCLDGHQLKKTMSSLCLPRPRTTLTFVAQCSPSLQFLVLLLSEESRHMDSVTAAPIRTPPDVSADDGAAATAADKNVAAAADAVAEMAEHLTIGTDNANAATGPVDLGAEGDIYSCKDCRTHTPRLTADIITKV